MRPLATLLAATVLAGCSTVHEYTPIIAPTRGVFADSCVAAAPATPNMTDWKAACFTLSVEQTFRLRAAALRGGQKAGAAAQVALSALAAAMNAMLPGSGTAANVAIAAASTSSIIPTLGGALGIAAATDVYSAGLQAVLDAESQYLVTVAKETKGVLATDQLTVEGAQMLSLVLGAVQLTEKKLSAPASITPADFARATVAPAPH
jgi:hypothetical protein